MPAERLEGAARGLLLVVVLLLLSAALVASAVFLFR
jgi:hypothetical protein